VILGVDELMDMARTMVNLVGNCLATVVMGRWEGEFKPGTESVAQAIPAKTALPAMAPESSGS
jgi:proton glutamate symport protein